jgi:hypothetical protein
MYSPKLPELCSGQIERPLTSDVAAIWSDGRQHGQPRLLCAANMSQKHGWALLALGTALVHCGGIAATTTDSGHAAHDDGGSTASGSGGNAGGGGCPADALEAGCAGEAGDSALEPYARLRTACRLSPQVNRRGPPVAISFCIQ